MTREKALQIIYDRCQHCDETDKAFEILKENKGEWINGDETRWKCSVCHYGVLDWNNTPFCPNCGADMKEVSE